MAHFLSAYETTFRVKHFSWLKMIDPVSKVSGYSCRHFSLCTFIMCQNLQRLTRVWECNEGFDEFVIRKSTHNDDDIIKTYDFLSASLFKDVDLMFEKHFTKQCCSEKLVKLALASTSEVSTVFARWLFNAHV